MTELIQYDKGNPKLPRHFKPSQIEDEYETPAWLYSQLCIKWGVYPKLDVCATLQNRKCLEYFDLNQNALEQEWTKDAWMNDPHSLHAEFAEKAYQQWQKHNISIMAIFPANCCRTSYWHKYIEGHAEYHAIEGSIRFLYQGRLSKDSSRNAYLCVVWRKRA